METGAGEIGFCKWLLGGMAALILLLVAWIKTLLADNKATTEARIADLKEQYKTLRHNGNDL